jgi:hypothetical protein
MRRAQLFGLLGLGFRGGPDVERRGGAVGQYKPQLEEAERQRILQARKDWSHGRKAKAAAHDFDTFAGRAARGAGQSTLRTQRTAAPPTPPPMDPFAAAAFAAAAAAAAASPSRAEPFSYAAWERARAKAERAERAAASAAATRGTGAAAAGGAEAAGARAPRPPAKAAGGDGTTEGKRCKEKKVPGYMQPKHKPRAAQEVPTMPPRNTGRFTSSPSATATNTPTAKPGVRPRPTTTRAGRSTSDAAEGAARRAQEAEEAEAEAGAGGAEEQQGAAPSRRRSGEGETAAGSAGADAGGSTARATGRAWTGRYGATAAAGDRRRHSQCPLRDENEQVPADGVPRKTTATVDKLVKEWMAKKKGLERTRQARAVMRGGRGGSVRGFRARGEGCVWWEREGLESETLGVCVVGA